MADNEEGSTKNPVREGLVNAVCMTRIQLHLSVRDLELAGTRDQWTDTQQELLERVHEAKLAVNWAEEALWRYDSGSKSKPC